jgi:thioredoxin reductase (NADPH)
VRKPIILTVDDDLQVLAAVERDLKRKYAADYRIVRAASGKEALETSRTLKERGDSIALFLVDQRMPEISGTEFLLDARKLFPDAKKVLLTAYADTDAAIQSINVVGLDHYLMKPWDPPEEKLFPVLDDLLGEWGARVRLPYEGIRVVGAVTSPQSYAAKEFLSRNLVPYQWIDVDTDESMRALVHPAGEAPRPLPVILFPDGTSLSAPTSRELADKCGLQTQAQKPFYDVVIIGGGPAGLAHAVYAASEGLKALLIEAAAPGGAAGTSSRIENYLGFPTGVSGADLAQRAMIQARRFGAEVLTAQEVVGIERRDPYRITRLADGTAISSYCVIVTTGQAVRPLEAPGIEKLLGIGVYYGAAMSEAATYRDRDVLIVGGANSAGQGALFFARFAKSVTILVRAKALRPGMSEYLAARIDETPNVNVITGVEVTEVRGTTGLEQVVVRCPEDGAASGTAGNGGTAVRTLDAAAMFIFIGTAPRTDAFASVLDRDEKGFILTGAELPRINGRPRGWTLEREPLMFETNVPGVFAAGDVRAAANRRVAAAVGEGSAAIYSVQRYLRTV